MSISATLSVEHISIQEFQHALARYPSIIEAVSQKKGAKDGQATLEELDIYRYDEITASLTRSKPHRTLDLEDVKKLVQWKLRHGKFRPTLMKLVSSNDPDTTKTTIGRAVKLYRDKADAASALTILCELRGIGPATASLLLAVHEPESVIFFGDEVFYWICCDSKIQSAKYNAKEYAALHKSAMAIVNRLGVTMANLEKVAYVAMKQNEYPDIMGADAQPSASKAVAAGPRSQRIEEVEKSIPKAEPKAKSNPKGKVAKRKDISDSEKEGAPLRRSKRTFKGKTS